MFSRTLGVLRSMPVPFRVLLAGVFLNRLGTFILPFLTIVLVRDYGFSAAAAGRLLFAYGLGSAVSLAVGGHLTDRIGRRRTLLLSLFGSGGLAVATPFAGTGAAFVAVLLLLGFLADLFRPAASAMIADLLPPERRAEGFACLRTAVNLGWAVGLSLGGFVAEHDFRWLFWGDGATTLLFALVVLAGVPESGAPAPAPAAGPGRRPGILGGVPWRDRVFLETALANFAWATLIISFMTVLPLTITEGAGYGAEVFGFAMGLNGLLVAIFEIPVVSRLAGMRRLRVAAFGTLLGGAAVAATALVPHWAWFLLVMAVYTAGEISVVPQVMAFLSDWAPREARGRVLGIQSATFSLAFAVGPAVLLPLRAAVGDAAYWPLLLGFALPAAALLLRLDRTADRPEALRGRR